MNRYNITICTDHQTFQHWIEADTYACRDNDVTFFDKDREEVHRIVVSPRHTITVRTVPPAQPSDSHGA